MTDELKRILERDGIANATPTGEAAAHAREELAELDALPPAESEPFHIGQEGVVTQTGEDPISDLTGRRNGP